MSRFQILKPKIEIDKFLPCSPSTHPTLIQTQQDGCSTMFMNTFAIVIDYSATRCDVNNQANKDEPNLMKQQLIALRNPIEKKIAFEPNEYL